MLSQARYLEEPKTVIYEKALCTLNYGEFIFGYKAWSSKTGITYQRLRGLITKLLKDNMLILKTQTNHFTVYEITNYAKFNSQKTLISSRLDGDINSQVTASQQSGNSQVTTNKESNNKDKNVENDKEDISIVQFEEFWKLYPKKLGKTAALKTWNTLIKNRTNPDDLITASRNYATSRKGQEEKFTLQASTFLGPQKRFEDFIKGGTGSDGSNEVNKGDSKPWENDPYCIALSQAE